MDNLIAENKARPFLIGMAYGLTNERGFGPRGGRGGGRGPGLDPVAGRAGPTNGGRRTSREADEAAAAGSRALGNIPEFEHVLVNDLIPYVDGHFRTLADQPHRAMARLSMGGAETRPITLAHLEVFSHIGLFSGGLITPEDVSTHADFKDKVKVVFCSCGSREDPASLTANHDALDKIGVEKCRLRVAEHCARVPDVAAQLA